MPIKVIFIKSNNNNKINNTNNNKSENNKKLVLNLFTDLNLFPWLMKKKQKNFNILQPC